MTLQYYLPQYIMYNDDLILGADGDTDEEEGEGEGEESEDSEFV